MTLVLWIQFPWEKKEKKKKKKIGGHKFHCRNEPQGRRALWLVVILLLGC